MMTIQELREIAKRKLELLDTVELCFVEADPSQTHIPLNGLYELRRLIVREYGDTCKMLEATNDSTDTTE